MLKLLIFLSGFYILQAPAPLLLIFCSGLVFLLPEAHMACYSDLLIIDSSSWVLIGLSIWVGALAICVGGAHNMVSLLMCVLVLSFSVSDFLSFYVMFEFSLIPIFFIIMGGGYQPDRLSAGVYLVMYTVLGSLPFLVAIMVGFGLTFDLSMYTGDIILPSDLTTLWAYAFMGGFIVKLPVYGAHLWLPKAHVEAPVGGSMLLAGVLLKLGGYGMLRALDSCQGLAYMLDGLYTMCLVGGVYAGMACLSQTDLKSMIAYTSIAHMGLMSAGLISGSAFSGMIIMFSHGLTSSALFVFSYILSTQAGTRSMILIKGYGGVSMFGSHTFFVLICLNLAAPLTLNFVGEVLAISSCLAWSEVSMLLSGSMVFLAGAYSLYMYSSVVHGEMCSLSVPMNVSSCKCISVVWLHIFPLFLMLFKLGVMFFM